MQTLKSHLYNLIRIFTVTHHRKNLKTSLFFDIMKNVNIDKIKSRRFKETILEFYKSKIQKMKQTLI